MGATLRLVKEEEQRNKAPSWTREKISDDNRVRSVSQIGFNPSQGITSQPTTGVQSLY